MGCGNATRSLRRGGGLTPPPGAHRPVPAPQSTKAVYDRILDLRIATPQIVINYAMFLEEHKYFEESFKVRGSHPGVRDTVLCSGRPHKVPPTGRLNPRRCVFFTVEAQSLRSRCGQGGFPPRAPPSGL